MNKVKFEKQPKREYFS